MRSRDEGPFWLPSLVYPENMKQWAVIKSSWIEYGRKLTRIITSARHLVPGPGD